MELTRSEASSLIYLEVCCVDYGGLVQSQRMNKDDYDNIEKFTQEGLLSIFERLPMSSVDHFRSQAHQQHTHFIKLSPEGWRQSHIHRIKRAERCRKKNSKYTRKGVEDERTDV